MGCIGGCASDSSTHAGPSGEGGWGSAWVLSHCRDGRDAAVLVAALLGQEAPAVAVAVGPEKRISKEYSVVGVLAFINFDEIGGCGVEETSRSNSATAGTKGSEPPAEQATSLAKVICRCSEMLYANRKLSSETRSQLSVWFEEVLESLASASAAPAELGGTAGETSYS